MPPSATTGPFPFLKLPLELRNEVYRYLVLGGEEGFHPYVSFTSRPVDVLDSKKGVLAPESWRSGTQKTTQSTWTEACWCMCTACGRSDSSCKGYEHHSEVLRGVAEHHHEGRFVNYDQYPEHRVRFTYTYGDAWDDQCQRPDVAILSVCQQLYDEATDILYGETTFYFEQPRFNGCRTYWGGHPFEESADVSRIFPAFIMDRPKHSQRKIRSVTMDFCGAIEELNVLQTLSKDLQLKQLRLHFQKTPYGNYTRFPAAARGFLNTLWIHYISPMPNIQSLTIYVDLSTHHSERHNGRMNRLIDFGANLVSTVAAKILGESIAGRAAGKVSMQGNKSGSRVECFYGHKGPVDEFDPAQPVVCVRREHLSEAQQAILNREVSPRVGLSSKRPIWITEELAHKMSVM